jgi:NitT/TauT family transport system substrate-binding protein
MLGMSLAVCVCTPADAQTTSPAPVPPAPSRKVLFSHIPSLIYLPAYVAVTTGEFAREGLTVDFIQSAGGSEAMAALLSGSVQFTVRNLDVVATLREQGQVLKAVVGLESQPTQSLVLSTRLKGKVPENVDTAVKIQAVKGLKLGISTPGSGTDVGLRALLSYYKLDPNKDVTIIAARGATETIAALVQGSLDGFFWPEPVPSQAVMQGNGFKYIDYRVEGPAELREVAYSVVVTTQKTIDADPELVSRTVRAVARAARTLSKDPGVAVPAAQKFIDSKLPEQLIRDVVKADANFYVSDIPERNVQGMIKGLVSSGAIKNSYKYEDLVATQFKTFWTAP